MGFTVYEIHRVTLISIWAIPDADMIWVTSFRFVWLYLNKKSKKHARYTQISFGYQRFFLLGAFY